MGIERLEYRPALLDTSFAGWQIFKSIAIAAQQAAFEPALAGKLNHRYTGGLYCQFSHEGIGCILTHRLNAGGGIEKYNRWNPVFDNGAARDFLA